MWPPRLSDGLRAPGIGCETEPTPRWDDDGRMLTPRARPPDRGFASLAVPWPVIVVAGLMVVGLLVLSGEYVFHGDEMYYVVAGRHPAFGYVDQPPLTPLLPPDRSRCWVSRRPLCGCCRRSRWRSSWFWLHSSNGFCRAASAGSVPVAAGGSALHSSGPRGPAADGAPVGGGEA
jgi:hypothetical protein